MPLYGGVVKRSEAKENARKRGQILKEKFMKMKDFVPSQRVVGLENRYIFAIDQTRRKVAYNHILDSIITECKSTK